MADRDPGSTPWRLLADLGSGGLTGTVELTNPWWEAAGSVAFIEVGLGRYRASITPTGDIFDGLWVATWKDGSDNTLLVQPFTVGNDLGITKFEARMQAARRVGALHYGHVSSATTTTITDSTLIGGADDHNARWVMLDPNSNESGLERMVTDFSASALTLHTAFAGAPTAGHRYALFHETMQPSQIDTTMEQVITGLGDSLWVPVQFTVGNPDEDGIVSIPRGWSHVHKVMITDEDGIRHEVNPSYWTPMQDNKLYIGESEETWEVDLYGIRFCRVPVWEDSIVDINPLILVPAVAHSLLMDFARGQLMDPDDHRTRANLIFQEYGVQLTIRAPRFPKNAKKVIE
jgi:hypothetical protein